VPKLVRQEIETYEGWSHINGFSFELLIVFLFLDFTWLIRLERYAWEMRACDFPASHVLKTACDEFIVVVRIKFYAKNRKIAEISECNRPVLLPVENLYWKSSVHTYWDKLGTIFGKAEMQNSSSVRCVQDLDSLRSLSVPNVNLWIYIDLARRYQTLEGVLANTRYLHLMSLVKPLILRLKYITFKVSLRGVNKIAYRLVK